jgi:hypothetical protein
MRLFSKIALRPILLLAAVCPFLMGFDTPDSAGTYVGLAAGRGTYHLVGCRGHFDSEFWETQASVKHRFDLQTRESQAGGGWMARGWETLKPAHVTPGVFAGALSEELTLV